ncbi:hypothetical protein [Novosphingobium guangzhouense]|uniref:hypothetical protein n=1 Tax=Novosphingobium guangzhouense TaxID=1850347 RepID=UPI001FE687F0|nr:hypothetical protein [Novosphingobium guangzhouense]
MNARSIALSALILMASGCSTVQLPPRTAKVSPQLLAPPPALPKVQRSADGQMTGADAQTSLQALYDVAGQIRAALVELQSEVRLAQGNSDAQGR